MTTVRKRREKWTIAFSIGSVRVLVCSRLNWWTEFLGQQQLSSTNHNFVSWSKATGDKVAIFDNRTCGDFAPRKAIRGGLLVDPCFSLKPKDRRLRDEQAVLQASRSERETQI